MPRLLIACFAVLLILQPLNAVADERYEVAIEGMVCAYCAYTVTRQLESLPGVKSESVTVDLSGGSATFTATETLEVGDIKSVFTDSGFQIQGMVRRPDTPEPTGPTRERMLMARIQLERNLVDSGLARQSLDAVGSAAAKPNHRLSIMAPEAVETELLKPLLAGRQAVIPVDFEASDKGFVRVTLYRVAPETTTDDPE